MTTTKDGQPLLDKISEEIKQITNIDLADMGRQLSQQIPTGLLITGNKWLNEVTFMLPPPITGGSFKVDMECEVVGKEIIDGYECFVIKTNSRKSDILMLTDKHMPMETDFIDVSHIGFSYLYFSAELGHLVRKVSSQTLNVVVYLASDGDRQPVNNIIRTEMDSIITYLGTREATN